MLECGSNLYGISARRMVIVQEMVISLCVDIVLLLMKKVVRTLTS